MPIFTATASGYHEARLGLFLFHIACYVLVADKMHTISDIIMVQKPLSSWKSREKESSVFIHLQNIIPVLQMNERERERESERERERERERESAFEDHEARERIMLLV
jgi:hypothetical protein